jgi:hypothetical protein
MSAQPLCDVCKQAFSEFGASWLAKVCKACYDKEMAARGLLCADCRTLLLPSLRCYRFPAYCQDCYHIRLAATHHYFDHSPQHSTVDYDALQKTPGKVAALKEDENGLIELTFANVPEWLESRLQWAVGDVVTKSVEGGEFDRRLRVPVVVEAQDEVGKMMYPYDVGYHNSLRCIMQRWCQFQEMAIEDMHFRHEGTILTGEESVASLGYGPMKFIGHNAIKVRLMADPVPGSQLDGGIPGFFRLAQEQQSIKTELGGVEGEEQSIQERLQVSIKTEPGGGEGEDQSIQEPLRDEPEAEPRAAAATAAADADRRHRRRRVRSKTPDPMRRRRPTRRQWRRGILSPV